MGCLAFGQVNIDKGEKPSIFERLYFGGNFWASFGDPTVIYVSPTVGYMITRSFSAGIGITYQYYKSKFFDYQTNTYGGKLFARQNITFIKLPLFLYGEYERLNLDVAKTDPNNGVVVSRDWVPRLLLGGGLFQPIGKKRGGFYIAILYDVIYQGFDSPYSSPWVYRIGFNF